MQQGLFLQNAGFFRFKICKLFMNTAVPNPLPKISTDSAPVLFFVIFQAKYPYSPEM